MAVAWDGMRKAVEFEDRVSSRYGHHICQPWALENKISTSFHFGFCLVNIYGCPESDDLCSFNEIDEKKGSEEVHKKPRLEMFQRHLVTLRPHSETAHICLIHLSWSV